MLTLNCVLSRRTIESGTLHMQHLERLDTRSMALEVEGFEVAVRFKEGVDLGVKGLSVEHDVAN